MMLINFGREYCLCRNVRFPFVNPTYEAAIALRILVVRVECHVRHHHSGGLNTNSSLGTKLNLQSSALSPLSLRRLIALALLAKSCSIFCSRSSTCESICRNPLSISLLSSRSWDLEISEVLTFSS